MRYIKKQEQMNKEIIITRNKMIIYNSIALIF